VIDHATGLTWQQSGSKETMSFAEAEKYIQKLNGQEYAGHNDWRLPTLEEAMSLMEPSTKNGDLYIDPVFDKTQRWIWTADKREAGVAWVVSFHAWRLPPRLPPPLPLRSSSSLRTILVI